MHRGQILPCGLPNRSAPAFYNQGLECVDQIQHKTTGGLGPQVIANDHKFSPFYFSIFVDWVQNRISFHGQLIDRRLKQKDLWATGREDLTLFFH